MSEPRLSNALDRIDAALARIESRPTVDAARHARLREAMAESVAGMDRLIAAGAK
jgi:hypothetical protein